MAHFQRIGLFGNLDLPEVKDSLRKLETFLVSQGRDVIYERGTADIVDWSVKEILHTSEFAGAIDLGIVVGGDGSMLSASRKMASIGVPLLGINRGRLGFLTDISPDEIEARVSTVLSGDYVQTRRFMLETTVTRDNEVVGTEARTAGTGPNAFLAAGGGASSATRTGRARPRSPLRRVTSCLWAR